jgi:hypothetical protein
MMLRGTITQKAIVYTVGAGLDDNSGLKQDLCAKPAPTLETST